MAKSVHIRLANRSEHALVLAGEELWDGRHVDGFPTPAIVPAGIAVEWKTASDLGEVTGAATYLIGDTGGALSVFWRSNAGGTYDFDLTDGFELLGSTIEGDDVQIDLSFNRSSVHAVPGFVPSTNGFRFPNSFPPGLALMTIDLGFKKIPIGEACNGLCGGMAFAVRDYFQLGETIPQREDAPTDENDHLFKYLVKRLFASFDLPSLPVLLMKLMNPAYPKNDQSRGPVFRNDDSKARISARQEFAKLQTIIDSGFPAPICIVKTISTKVRDLGRNHQVVVHAYEVDGTILTLHIYDPNHPGMDDTTLTLDIGHTDRTIMITGNPGGPSGPIYCYFVTNYHLDNPPVVP